jgi:hypothetical protein
MKVNEAAASADSIALVARALRSIDTATVLLPPAPRRAKPPRASCTTASASRSAA